MITMKQVDLDELNHLTTYDKVNPILKKPLDPNEKYFVVLEDGKVLGHATLLLFPSILAAEITEIYIVPEERRQGLGDGLLRTIFNYLRIHSFNFTIIEYHRELESFLAGMDIKKVSIDGIQHEIKDILKNKRDSEWYICRINEFFKRKCRGEFK